MNGANERFQRDMTNAKGQEGPIVQALLALRKEMAFLTDAINLPAIPEKDRGQYVQLVRAQADKMQQSLEDSAKNDRSGKLASIVRNHKIN
jgi:tRNA U34 5-carboxymethylaminomethyl modifying enzyme MnmG/GidA